MALFRYNGTTGKLVPITSDGSIGLPVGAVIGFYGPVLNNNWLECNGRDTTGTAEELATHYPALYTYLGNSNVLPDLRDRALFGIGGDLINVGDTTNGAIPNIKGHIRGVATSTNNDGFSDGVLFSDPSSPTYTRSGGNSNTGATAIFNANKYNSIYKDNHSYVTPKSVGVRWCIKATSAGIEVDKDLYATKGYIRDQNVLSDYEQISIPSSGLVVDYDGYVTVRTAASGSNLDTVDFYINSRKFQLTRYTGAWTSASYPLCKGDKIIQDSGVGLYYFRFYKLRDYTGR